MTSPPRVAAAAAAVTTSRKDDASGDPPSRGRPAHRPLATTQQPRHQTHDSADAKNDADANDDAMRAAAAAVPSSSPSPTIPPSPSPSASASSSLDYSQAAEAIRDAELSRVPLPRDHLAARRRPLLSPTDISGADWCQLRSAFRLAAPWLAAGGEAAAGEETREMRRGKEAHREREEAPPPGLTLQQAVALGLRGPDARVEVRPQTRADRVALKAVESAGALLELLQFGRAREVWVFGRVPLAAAPLPPPPPAAGARSEGEQKEGDQQQQQQQQWLTGVVDQVERRPKGWAARAAAEGAAAARGEVGVGAPRAGEPLRSARRPRRRRRRRSGGDGGDDGDAAKPEEEEEKEEQQEAEEQELLVTELKTRGCGGTAPSEAALRGAAIQAALYRRLLAGFALEAREEAEALLAPKGGGSPRPGGFLEAQGVDGAGGGGGGLEPLSDEVGALVGECKRAIAAALLPSLLPSSSGAAARPATPPGVIVLSADDSPRPPPLAVSPRCRLRPRPRSAAAAAAASAASPAAAAADSAAAAPPPPPPTQTRTVADALLALSRLAAAALPPPADHVRVEFVAQGEAKGEKQGGRDPDASRLIYGAWVDLSPSSGGGGGGGGSGGPGASVSARLPLARRAAAHLAFLRGRRPPTRRSGDPLCDSGCRWCVFRERCAGLEGVREDGDEEEDDDAELF